jgi:hypothetical protein
MTIASAGDGELSANSCCGSSFERDQPIVTGKEPESKSSSGSKLKAQKIWSNILDMRTFLQC